MLYRRCATPCPPHEHTADVRPFVSLWVVHLNAAQAVRAVKPANHIDPPLKFGHARPGAGRVHGGDGGPLLRHGVVPEKKRKHLNERLPLTS